MAVQTCIVSGSGSAVNGELGRYHTDLNIAGGNCNLNFYWDTAELVVAAPKKQTRKSNAKSKPVPQTPQWYLPLACEVDAAEARAQTASETALAAHQGTTNDWNAAEI
jgi:hypothetical protein